METLYNIYSFFSSSSLDLLLCFPLAPLVLAAIIGGAASAVGTAASSGAQAAINSNNEKLAREQMDWQEEQNTIAYERQKEMYQMQKADNSVNAQLKQWTDAGMNPLSYSGQSFSASQNISSPSVTPVMPDTRNPIESLPNVLQQTSRGMLDAAKTQSDIKKQEADIIKSTAETLYWEGMPKKLEAEVQNIVAHTELLSAQVAESELDAQSKSIYNTYLGAMQQAEVERLRIQNQFTKEQMANLLETRKLIQSETKLNDSQRGQVIANTKLIGSQLGINEKSMERLTLDIIEKRKYIDELMPKDIEAKTLSNQEAQNRIKRFDEEMRKLAADADVSLIQAYEAYYELVGQMNSPVSFNMYHGDIRGKNIHEGFRRSSNSKRNKADISEPLGYFPKVQSWNPSYPKSF
ncbi:minor capsid protein [Capybara microvirus Cap1_SP_104]|nr:minor capsid protein [Capybara microvirus Cap1_SP_104]